jgi:DNA-binding transcriptional ArsR family regulator
MLDEAKMGEMAEMFSALSDSSRLRIIAELISGEKNVGTIAEQVGLSESATSHHLRSLRQMRIVQARKEGRQVFYSLIDDHVRQLYQVGLEHIIHG